jgi:hypothetical protein
LVVRSGSGSHGGGRSGVDDVRNCDVDLINHLFDNGFFVVVVHGAPSVRGFEPIRGTGYATLPSLSGALRDDLVKVLK